MKKMSNKVSYFAITAIMGAIMFSFILTGFQGFGSNAGQVASVDGTPVTLTEYNQALQYEIKNWTQRLKAKSLTSLQIKQFRIRENTLEQLIMQKHMQNFARDLNFDAGKLAIKDEIKEYKVFQTGNKFDVTKYKALLKQNRLSPTKFEDDIIKQVKSKKMSSALRILQDSKSSSASILRLRNLKMKSYVISWDKESLTAFLKVPAKEINKFVTEKDNEKLLKGFYKTYEAEQKSKKLKVKKMTKVKMMLAKKHLQKTKRKELTQLNEKLSVDFNKALSSKDLKKVKSLAKKYKIDFDSKYEFSPFNLRYKTAKFSEEDILSLFKMKDTSKVLVSDTATMITLIRANKFESQKVKADDLKNEIAFSAQRNSRLLESSVLSARKKSAKVTRSAALFN